MEAGAPQGQPGQPGGQPAGPPAGQTGDSGDGWSAQKTWLAVGAVVLIAGAGVAGYFIGDSAADADGARQEGERAGLEQGKKEGLEEGRKAGVRTGFREGRRAGLERGEKVGEVKGDREGIASGASAALGGYPSWETGFWVVNVEAGTEVPYTVMSRLQMEQGKQYNLCTDNPAEICTHDIPSN